MSGPSRPLRVRLTLAFSVVLLAVGGLILALALLLVRGAFDATPGPPPGSRAVVEVPGQGTFLVPADELQQALRDRALSDLLRRGALAVLLVGGVGVGGVVPGGRPRAAPGGAGDRHRPPARHRAPGRARRSTSGSPWRARTTS